MNKFNLNKTDDPKTVQCETSLKTALNAVPTEVGLIIYDVDRDEKGNIIDWIIRDANEKTLGDFGLPRERFLNRRATEIYQENPNLASLFDLSNEVMLTGEARRFEMNLPWNGQRLLMAFFPFDQNTLVHTAIDLTEQRRTEEALRDSEDRLMLALEASQMEIWDWNIVRDYIDCSELCRALLGIEPSTTFNYETFLSKVHPEDRNHVEQTISDAIKNNLDYSVEMRMVLPDGTIRWIASLGRAFYNVCNQPVRMTGVVIDISERKKVEESLRIANERLMKADRQKDEFIAILSHELCNPLASIRNSLYIIEQQGPGEEKPRKALDIIERQVDQLCRMVDDLLDVTRIQNNRIQLQLQQLELNEVVHKTVEDYQNHFEKKDIAIETHYSPVNLYLNADGARLAQVMGNLLLNAVKFTDRRGRVTLKIEANSSKQQAIIELTDTGIGMEKETLQHLFSPFVQANQNLDRSRGGLGLGLALVKELVALHGGTVTADSEGLGKGSTFTVCLPLNTPSVSTNNTELYSSHPNQSVLIIEDNVDVAQSLCELLKLFNYEVAVAYDGKEGIYKARYMQPDILLCDIGLPEMDGFEVAKAFRIDPMLQRTYLVALTGYALPEDIHRAIAAGFDCHVAKPPELAVLQQVFSRAASR